MSQLKSVPRRASKFFLYGAAVLLGLIVAFINTNSSSGSDGQIVEESSFPAIGERAYADAPYGQGGYFTAAGSDEAPVDAGCSGCTGGTGSTGS